MRPSAILLTLAAGAVIAGCATNSTTTTTTLGAARIPSRPASTRTSMTTSASPTTTTSTSASASVPRAAQAARAFAAAYGRYLDGRLPAVSLPDATAAAISEVGSVIPPARRAGTLALESVQPTGSGPTFLVSLRDQTHTIAAKLTLSEMARSWRVTAIVPPDLDTVLRPAPGPIRAPAGSQPARQAASAFLTGYLRWLYGHAPAEAITSATTRLLARLKANPPNVPPAFRVRSARLAALGLRPAPGGGWTAFAAVDDGHQTYELTLIVLAAKGRWLVTAVGSGQ